MCSFPQRIVQNICLLQDSIPLPHFVAVNSQKNCNVSKASLFLQQTCLFSFQPDALTVLLSCQDLLHMGIKNRGHRNKIMQHIKRLPPEDIEEEVPVGFL